MTKGNLKFLSKEKNSEYFNYFFIGVTIIVFNLIAVFGPKGLLNDDPGMYHSVIAGEFPWQLFRFNLISPFTEWLGWNIMAYSPQLARGLYVLFLLIPLSCCFYYLCRSIFGFSRVTAFTAAVLPNILPMQWQIPAGINVCYVVWGLLFSVISLIIGFHYLEKDTSKNWIRLASAILCYLIATQIMEQALFLFPPLVLAFWGYKKFDRKNFILILSFSIVVVSKFLHIVMFPRKASQIMPFDIILKRIGLYFQWTLPVPGIPPVYAVIIFLGIVSTGFLLYIAQPINELKPYRIFSHFPAKIHHSLLYGFFVCWVVSTMFPLILLSLIYKIRYTYISIFGAQAILVFSIYVILKKLFPRKSKICIFVFIGIIVLSGVNRIIFLKKHFDVENKRTSIIIRDLNKIPLPLNAQVVIVNLKRFYGGWHRASGYFQFSLKRNDVTGLAGRINSSEYYNFDNHFDPEIRGWPERYQMTGLSIGKPVFLFYFDEKNRKLKQYEYALQWRGEKKGAPWTIFQVHKTTGQIFPFVSGVGMKQYVTAIRQLRKRGIQQSEILWGGPPTSDEQKRLKGEKTEKKE